MPVAEPLGTVKILKRSGAARRYVKVSHHGPRWQRWIPYARYLWQQRFQCEVPDGCQIGFADGNPLNDSRDNIVLLVPGRLAAAIGGKDPRSKRITRKQRRKQRAAVIKANRRRGAVSRASVIRRQDWYLVLNADRMVIMRPCRSKRAAMLLVDDDALARLDLELSSVAVAQGEEILAGMGADGAFEGFGRTS